MKVFVNGEALTHMQILGHSVPKTIVVPCVGEIRAEFVIAPELFLCGYPPRDLLLRPDFIEANLTSLAEVLALEVEKR